LIMRVMASIFSAVKDDLASVRRYSRNVTEVIALSTFPIAIGLAVTAPEFVSLALGAKWGAAVVPLQILALSIPCRAISALLPQVLIALGNSRRLLGNTLLTAAVMPVCFFFGARWGMEGVGAAWVVVYPMCALPLFHVTLRRIGMPLGEYLSVIYKPVLAAAIMAVSVWVTGKLLPAAWPLIGIAAAKVLVGVAIYALVVWGIYPNEKFAAWRDFVRRGRSGAGRS
jgi:O-antigen/teichoic acid export membrane protein